MNKNKFAFPVFAMVLALSACGPTTVEPTTDEKPSEPSVEETTTANKNPNYQKVLSPQGAPAIAFYDQGANPNFETNAVPKNVMGQLTQDNYGMVVMDFFGGLNTIKKANSEYKLARILTGGNLYLVNRAGKTTKPTASDKVVVFGGETSLPVLTFKHLFPEVDAKNLINVPSVKEAGAALKEGKVNGETVEYVLVAQPILMATMSKMDDATKANIKVVSKLRDDWKEKTGQDAIPQAGLFVHHTMYEENKSYFEEQLNLIDARLDKAINAPKEVKAKMDEQIAKAEDQQKVFGFNSNVVVGVQTNKLTPNGFACVSKEEAKTIDIHDFLKEIGNNNDYSQYIL